MALTGFLAMLALSLLANALYRFADWRAGRLGPWAFAAQLVAIGLGVMVCAAAIVVVATPGLVDGWVAANGAR